MISYQKEMLARDRMNERLADAERERSVRRPSRRGARPQPWRARMALAIARRLVRAAGAS